MFIDPDDTIHPEYLQELICACRKHDFAICGYNKTKYNNTKETTVYSVEISYSDFINTIISAFDNTLLFMCCNKMYRADIIENNRLRFPECKKFEDNAFVFAYLSYCNSSVLIQQPLYNYYVYSSEERKSLGWKFGEEHSVGAFISYENGMNAIGKFRERGYDKHDVNRLEDKIKRHLQSCILGDLITGMAKSKLTISQREDYVMQTIRMMQDHHIIFDRFKTDLASTIVRYLIDRKHCRLVAIFSYLYGYWR